MTSDPSGQGRDAAAERLSPALMWGMLIVATLVAVVLFVLAVEGVVRVRQVLKYGTAKTADQLYHVDQRTGLRVPLANLSAGPIHTNSLGFRSPEILVEKAPDIVRIAFIGASTTWCAEVSSDQHTWPSAVVKQLALLYPGRRFEFVNAGVPGYTVSASLRRLRHQVAPLKPDIVLIYHSTNDMSGELRRLAISRGLASSAGVQENSVLARYSVAWNLVQKNLQILATTQAARRNINRLDVSGTELGLQFGADLRALIDEAKRVARFVLVATFSTRLRPQQTFEEQLESAASALYYAPFMSPESLMYAYAAYNRVIEQVVNDMGIVLIADHDSIPGNASHFIDSVHFTDQGAEAMARRITRGLMGEPEIDAWLRSDQIGAPTHR